MFYMCILYRMRTRLFYLAFTFVYEVTRTTHLAYTEMHFPEFSNDIYSGISMIPLYLNISFYMHNL